MEMKEHINYPDEGSHIVSNLSKYSIWLAYSGLVFIWQSLLKFTTVATYKLFWREKWQLLIQCNFINFRQAWKENNWLGLVECKKFDLNEEYFLVLGSSSAKYACA